MTTLLRRLAAVLSLALGVALLVASPASATTLVSGTITNADGVPQNGYVYFQLQGSGSAGGVTLSNGQYTAPAVADGTYVIFVSSSTMDGYRSYYDGSVSGTPTPADATPIVLAGTPLVIDMTLPSIAKVSGHVTNGAGQPMAGVTVLRNRLGSGGSAPPTDSNGFYDFGYLRAGTINVTVNGQGDWAGAQQSVVVPASGTLTVDLVMPAAAHIVGTLTDSGTLEPLPFVNVVAYRTSDSAYQNTVLTDAAGQFDVGGLGVGDFALQFSDNLGGYPTRWSGGALTLGSAQHITTTEGATVTHDEQLTAKPAPWADPSHPEATLGGVVTGDGATPLAGIEVEARDRATGDVYLGTSDRWGRWAAAAPPGDFTVGFHQGFWHEQYFPAAVPWYPEYYPDAWGPADAATVSLPSSTQVLGLDVQLGRSARLPLTVRAAGGSTDLNAGYRVYDGSGQVVFEDLPMLFDGNQLAVLLRPGSWKLLVSGRLGTGTNDPALLSQWYGGGASLAAAPALSVAAGDDVAPATLTLPTGLATTTRPRVKGKSKVGKRLTVTKGSWNLMTGTTVTFRWLRGTTVVSKKSSYVAKRKDAGKLLKARVTAKNGGLTKTVTVKVRIRR